MRRADISLGGDGQMVDDYWRLVYSADHHNWNRRFRVLLDPPLGEVSSVELHEPGTAPRGPARFLLLDAAGDVVRELEIAGVARERLQSDTDPEFIRGDANADGHVDMNDPMRLLRALFLAGDPAPCRDAADANDDGRVDVSDVVHTLFFLYVDETGRFEPPWPGPWQCGRDLSPDDLPTCGFDIDLCLE